MQKTPVMQMVDMMNIQELQLLTHLGLKLYLPAELQQLLLLLIIHCVMQEVSLLQVLPVLAQITLTVEPYLIGQPLAYKVQWGRPYINADNDYHWYFPTAFRTSTYTVLSTEVESTVGSESIVAISSMSLSYCTFLAKTVNMVNAIAIGRNPAS